MNGWTLRYWETSTEVVLNRQVWANSVDPDQIKGAVWSDARPVLFAILHLLDALEYDKTTLTQFKDNYIFSGVSNFLRRSFYKLCLRKELLCYNWNQFWGRVHVGGRRCFIGYSIYWTIDINCWSKCLCKILKNILSWKLAFVFISYVVSLFFLQLITTWNPKDYAHLLTVM